MIVPPNDSRLRGRRRLVSAVELREKLLPLPKSTLHEMARQGRLPGVVKVGRRTLFDLDVLEAWLDEGGHRSSESGT